MKTTNTYFDFEFIDDGQTITPISVGMCTDDRQLAQDSPEVLQGLMAAGDYCLSHLYIEYQFDPSRANDWVRKHVFPHLQYFETYVGTGRKRPAAAHKIQEWVAEVCGDTKPRFVGYYPSYDWVLLCQHFGTMMQTPDGWPMRPICLRQLAEDIGIPSSEFPKQSGTEHHALSDAIWIRELDGFLHKRWERNSP